MFVGLGLVGAYKRGDQDERKAVAADEFGEDRGTCLVEVLAPDKSEAVGRRGSGVTVGKSDPGRLGVKLGRGIRGLIKLRDRDA